jgi:hypothetical protein
MARTSKIAQLVVLIKGGRQIAVPSSPIERSNTMDYKLKLNTQEDENAPRGTRYFVDIEREEPWFCVEAWGYTWEDAMAKAIETMKETGVI